MALSQDDRTRALEIIKIGLQKGLSDREMANSINAAGICHSSIGKVGQKFSIKDVNHLKDQAKPMAKRWQSTQYRQN